jgi:heme-degrading monooxygenase HmoA
MAGGDDMHARVTRMWLKDGAAAELVEGGKAYMTAGDKPEGWIGALLLISEDGAEAMSVTLWSSPEALAGAEAGTGYAAVMKPYEPLFSRPYERVNMAVGATTLIKRP